MMNHIIYILQSSDINAASETRLVQNQTRAMVTE